ncbi:MAG: hypothetical protein QM504_01460 [Pseudomonadota bacterium]
MKFALYSVIAFFYINSAFTQQNNQYIIDSIQSTFLNSKIKDSSLIANAHYKIGERYRYAFSGGDSAYYHYHKAEKLFKSLNDDYKRALALYGIAVIQKDEKDFTGSGARQGAWRI